MREVKLGDVCKMICSGGTPTSTNASYYNGDIPWLNTNEVNFCNIYSTNKTISEEGLLHSAAKMIPANSVIVAMYGVTAGKSAITKIPLTTNQACCNLIIDEKKADYRYVFYYLMWQSENLNKLANGGAQQNLNSVLIKKYKLPLPPLPTQQRIASILSTYDTMIENNNRRIKILEQMAENLYKEWFVRFRFPGYENCQMVDGLPEGWKVGSVKYQLKRYPFGRTYKDSELDAIGKVIVIDQSSSEYMGFHNDNPAYNATFDSPYILFGDHTCKFVLMTRPFSLGENIIPFTGDRDINCYYLFYALHNRLKTEEYKRHWSRLISMKMIVPCKHLQKEFEDKIKPICMQISTLQSQITTLTRQRDLMLPRLMSGQIEV